MRILIGCEFSGITREAFKAKGHYAVSCDLLPSEIPGLHYQGDIRDILRVGWDGAIFFPPCTYLAVSGARWFKDRPEKQFEALNFINVLLNAPIPHIALENPIGVISTNIRKPDQIIQPWMFGHPETKATCLWLKNLPKLKPTNIVPSVFHSIHKMKPSSTRGLNRSRMFLGIAEAMASQWFC